MAHEGPAWAIGDLVSCVRYVLAERGRHVGWQATGALRLLSDDGAFEADAKLAPYFRMGVKEAWTSDPKAGVTIWTPDAGAAEGFRSVSSSIVLPGLTATDLAPLCTSGDPREQARHSQRLARRIAERILDASPALRGESDLCGQ